MIVSAPVAVRLVDTEPEMVGLADALRVWRFVMDRVEDALDVLVAAIVFVAERVPFVVDEKDADALTVREAALLSVCSAVAVPVLEGCNSRDLEGDAVALRVVWVVPLRTGEADAVCETGLVPVPVDVCEPDFDAAPDAEEVLDAVGVRLAKGVAEPLGDAVEDLVTDEELVVVRDTVTVFDIDTEDVLVLVGRPVSVGPGELVPDFDAVAVRVLVSERGAVCV